MRASTARPRSAIAVSKCPPCSLYGVARWTVVGGERAQMTDRRRPLWRLAGDHADVGDGVTFLHRRYGTDIQDHTARRRMRFPHRLAEQISDVADFHALLHVPTALHHGIEDAVFFATDA